MKLEKPTNETLDEVVETTRSEPKWAQKGKPYNIPLKDFAFCRQEIDGNYNKKQTVYIIDSKEVGYLYCGLQDFLRLSNRVRDSHKMHPNGKNEPEWFTFTFE